MVHTFENADFIMFPLLALLPDKIEEIQFSRKRSRSQFFSKLYCPNVPPNSGTAFTYLFMNKTGHQWKKSATKSCGPSRKKVYNDSTLLFFWMVHNRMRLPVLLHQLSCWCTFENVPVSSSSSLLHKRVKLGTWNDAPLPLEPLKML